MGFFTFFNHFFTDSGELTYTLSEAVEKIGFGKFQIRILLMVGFFTVSVVLYMYLLDVSQFLVPCYKFGGKHGTNY